MKKFMRDKRDYKITHDGFTANIDKNSRILKIYQDFIERIADRVNSLLTAEDIDISLYA